jgi:hypothetical protein
MANQKSTGANDKPAAATPEDFYGTWVEGNGCLHTISADTYEITSEKEKRFCKISSLKWSDLEIERGKFAFKFSVNGTAESVTGWTSFGVGDDIQLRFSISKDKAMIFINGVNVTIICINAIRPEVFQKQQAEKVAKNAEAKAAKEAYKAVKMADRKPFTLQYIDCPTDHISFDDVEMYGIEAYKNYLFVNQVSRLTVWNMSDPTDIKQIREIKYPARGWRMQIIDDQLLLYGWKNDTDYMILVLDISNPLRVEQVGEYKLNSHIQKIVKSRGRLLAISVSGIVDFQADKLLSDLYLHSNYPKDWIADDDFMIHVRCDDGVRIFRIQPDGDLSLAKYIPSRDFIADSIHWDVPGKSFILCGGGTNISKFDMSVPENTKRVKGARTSSNLGEQIIREGNTLFAFGINDWIHGTLIDKLFVYEVDISDDTPVVLTKNEIKGFPRKNGPGADSARGIVRSGDYLILCTPDRGLGVVKINY